MTDWFPILLIPIVIAMMIGVLLKIINKLREKETGKTKKNGIV